MKTLFFSLLILFLVLPAVADNAKTSLYFPPAEGEWEELDPVSLGWDGDKLKEALTFAGKNKSSGVVILYRGRILAEQYWELEPPEKTSAGARNPYFHMRLGKDERGRAIEDVASAQKSVTAMLVGIAQEKRLLKLDDPAHIYLGEGWSKAPTADEAKITIRHLISMTSGLSARLHYKAPAGTQWAYNTTAYSRSLTCVAKAARLDENELTREWLTGPLGMKNTRWAPRPWADQTTVIANRFGLATTARDLARFGLLMLANGDWGGTNVLKDKDYIKAATSPSQELNPSYGYLWWLNGGPFVARGNGSKRAGRLISSAPKDLYAAQGKLGRRLYVIPSQQLVITRLGDQFGNNFDSEFLKRLRSASGK